MSCLPGHLCSRALSVVLSNPSYNSSTFQLKTQAPVLWYHELTGYTHNGRETLSILSFLMQMYLFLCFSHLLTNHTFQSLQQPSGLSQLERGGGCRQNHHAVQNNFTVSRTNNALILFQRFLSNKITVDNYKHSDRMRHTQHHRSQAQLSKRETVLLLFENSRKRTGGGNL